VNPEGRSDPRTLAYDSSLSNCSRDRWFLPIKREHGLHLDKRDDAIISI